MTVNSFRPILSALLLVIFIPLGLRAQLVIATPDVEAKLYLGKGKNQPLIVGLGGSEGGNAWASEHWRKTREQFIDKGYAFLAIGYFGATGTPDTLDRISLDNIHLAIVEAARNQLVNSKKIAIIGGSRGGDLALLLGSYYSDIQCVVAIVPSHVAFPGHTSHFSTSAWRYRGNELPFVPVNEAAVPYLMKRDLRGAFEAMLKDTVAEAKALIPVERIKGPILLVSATQDEMAPTTPMCEKMMQRLTTKSFAYPYKHIPVEGRHSEPLKHFDDIMLFLNTYFK